MVKIIDETPDPSVVKRIICKSCGSLLEYIPNEVKKYSGRDYSGGPDGHEWIDCPKCGKSVILRSW